jgi:1-phosphofructokinase
VIVTVTPAPAIDWTVAAPRFDVGEVNRAESLHREASGKGVNVSWALHKQDIATLAIFPAGGASGDFMTRKLSEAALPHRVVPVSGEVRTNMTLRVEGAPETKINTSTSPLSGVEIEALVDTVRQALPGARALLSCGSLPEGAPVSLHRTMIELATAAGVLAVVDSSGPALVEALLAKPNLVKPNLAELAELTGVTITTLGDVHDAGMELVAKGVGAVLVSLGGFGAVLIDRDGALYGRVSDVVVSNAVGAGDALLAGFVAYPDDRVSCLTRALVWASSSVQSESTLFSVDPSLEARVTISEQLDPALLVTEVSLPRAR